MLNRQQVLSFSGFPPLSDLESEEWKLIFQGLERDQQEFLSHQNSFRSLKYRWPHDALHTWSRLWEYPYVIHHLKTFRQANHSGELLRVADIGSGVTFFPFSVARMGCEVTCIDIDPICVNDIPRAAKVITHSPGKIGVRLMEGIRIPLADESQDVVYSISVLEHVNNVEDTISEIARILKPKGQFILTVDIDLRGDSELKAEAFAFLQKALAGRFRSAIPERVIHPNSMLTTENSQYPSHHQSILACAKQLIKNVLNGRPFGAKVTVGVDLTVYGTVLEKP